jgi:hypothetical protein
MSEEKDTIIARTPCCNRIVFAAMNDPKVLDTAMMKEIGELVSDGCMIEHVNVEIVRISKFGCKCKSH